MQPNEKRHRLNEIISITPGLSILIKTLKGDFKNDFVYHIRMDFDQSQERGGAKYHHDSG